MKMIFSEHLPQLRLLDSIRNQAHLLIFQILVEKQCQFPEVSNLL